MITFINYFIFLELTISIGVDSNLKVHCIDGTIDSGISYNSLYSSSGPLKSYHLDHTWPAFAPNGTKRPSKCVFHPRWAI